MDAIERENLLQIIRKQIMLYPKFNVQDLYKLFYQITQGGIHYIHEMASVRNDLSIEWRRLNDSFFDEPLIEHIDPQKKLIRVNLRPFKDQNGTPEQILSLFERSLKASEPDENRLTLYWEEAIKMAEEMELPFSVKIMTDYWETMKMSGFPPARHSKGYRKIHKPAYRLILFKYWEGKDPDE